MINYKNIKNLIISSNQHYLNFSLFSMNSNQPCQQHNNPSTLICINANCPSRLMCLLCEHNHDDFTSIRTKAVVDLFKFKKTVDRSIDSSLQIMEELQAGGIQKQKKMIIDYFNSVKEDFQKFLDLRRAQVLAVFRAGRNSDLEFLVKARIEGRYHQLPADQFNKIIQVFEGKNLKDLVYSEQQSVLEQAYAQMQQFHKQCQNLFQKFNHKVSKRPPQIRLRNKEYDNSKGRIDQQYKQQIMVSELKQQLKYQLDTPIQTLLTDAYSGKRQIITVGFDKMLRVFDKRLRLTTQKQFGNVITRMENIGLDTFALGVSKQLQIVKISPEEGFDAKNILVLKGHKQRIWDISMFNTRIIGSCSEEGTKIWDLYKQKCQYTVNENTNPSCIRFMPQVNMLSVGYHTHELKFYPLSTMKLSRCYQLKGVPLCLSQQNRNQNFIYCGGFHSEITLFDIRVGREVFTHGFKNSDAVSCLKQSLFEEESIILGHRNGNVRIFDLRKLNTRIQWNAHTKKGNLSKPNGVIRIFQEDKSHILTVGSNDCKAYIWLLNRNEND